MRRLIALAMLAGCASAGAPPGGPEDRSPPAIVTVAPDSGATSVGTRSVEFRFDEVVSDRPSGGKADINQLFLISPWDGSPRVRWHRNQIEVRPRRGFQANTAYSVTLLPGLSDLRGNVMKDSRTIVFATGPTFPRFGIVGRVFDWAAERPAPDAFVEAIALPDSLRRDSVRYVGVSDSLGAFSIGPLPEGTFVMRALIDQNNNREVDRAEKWDTTHVVVSGIRPAVELRAIERDSMPPVIVEIASPDTLTLQLAFDKWLDPNQPLGPTSIRVQRSDSSELQVVQVQSQAAFDRFRADSLRRADSVRADSVRRADTTRARQPVPPPAAEPSRGLPVGRLPVGPPPPKPTVPPPSKGLVVRLSPGTPLKALQTYRITTRGIHNLVGNVHDMSRTYSVPRVSADSARRPPSDSARRPPPRPPRTDSRRR